MKKYSTFRGYNDMGRVYRLFCRHGDDPNLELIRECALTDIAGIAQINHDCLRLNAEAVQEEVERLKALWLNARAERIKADEDSHSLNWRIADDAMHYLEKQLARLIFEDES